jgi:predicted metal-dependent phosphoesterase TrpH
MRIDLHTHSTASDGTDAPADLVRTAAAAGLDVVAVTDHDTTGGWAEAFAARPPGLTIVPGVEVSCVHHDADGRRTSLHLLAYLVDPGDAALTAEWERLRASRRVRGERMVDNLAAAGYPISWAQVSALASGGTVGRPHLGRALVESGVVPDVDAAFRDLLSSRQPYYVRKIDTDVFDAIRLVRAAGGWGGAGLVGLVVDNPDHSPEDRAHAARLARELDLVGTGSSDYHGTNKTTRIGAEVTAPEAYERLLALPAALAPVGD